MDSAGADLNVGTEELPYDIRIENLKASKVKTKPRLSLRRFETHVMEMTKRLNI